MTGAFGSRLSEVLTTRGHLCVGVDPHPHLLHEWALDRSAAGVRDFGLRVVEATASAGAGIVKPQVAFFERYGSAGYAALETVLAAARSAGLVVIADAKRGDIGSTQAAYAEAWLTPGGPLEADAVTVSPYLGVGALADTLALAETQDKGVFVLAATSNPEATALQRGDVGGRTVARSVADEVAARNTGARELGSAGLVVGATVDLAAAGLDAGSLVGTPLLAPGFGHQGARVEDARAIFGAAAAGLLVSASRSILEGGPDGLVGRVRDEAARTAAALR